MSLKKLFEKGYDKQSQNLYLEAIEEYNKVLKIDENIAYCKEEMKKLLAVK